MKKLTICHILFTILCINFNMNLFAQQISYIDYHYGAFATDNSRVVTTIKEFDNNDEVHIETFLIGELNIGTIQLNLFYDPNVVVPTMGPGGEEITVPMNGTGTFLGEYLWINPELPNERIWRTSATGQINPHASAPWTYIMIGGENGLSTNTSLEEGTKLPVFTIFFKKLSGKTLSSNTFTYYEKLTTPQVRNFFSRGVTSVLMSGIGNGETSFTNSNLFSRRVPSSVKTKNATVKGTHVTLKGIANSEGLPKVPVNSGVSSGLDWDTIVTTGFIYTKSNIHFSTDEYSKKLKINGVECDFPTETNGSFIWGTDTLFIVSMPNSNRDTRIEMNYLLTDLDPDEQYYAFAFMTYKFQTSDVYPAIGAKIGFETILPEIEFDVNATIVACNNEQSFQIEYDINVDEAEYKLWFSDESMAAGFVSVTEYVPLPESNISIALPQGLPAGAYAATLYVRYGSWEENYDIVITINSLPELIASSEPEIILFENEEFYLFVEAKDAMEYQWYFEGNIIHGANESYYLDTFIAEKEGTYSVVISNECGSLLHDFYVKGEPNSVIENDALEYKLTVYPNPVIEDGLVTLLLQLPANESPDATAYFFDMNGKKMFEYRLTDYATHISLDLASGTYLIRVRTKSGMQLVSKIIVTK